MITYIQMKSRLAAALNDLGEALTAALAWIEEGEALQPLAAASTKVARVFEKSPAA